MKKLLLMALLLPVGSAFGSGDFIKQLQDNSSLDEKIFPWAENPGFLDFNAYESYQKKLALQAYAQKASSDMYKRDSADLETYFKSRHSSLGRLCCAFSCRTYGEILFEGLCKAVDRENKLAEENNKKNEKASWLKKLFLSDNKNELALAWARMHVLRVELLDKCQ